MKPKVARPLQGARGLKLDATQVAQETAVVARPLQGARGLKPYAPKTITFGNRSRALYRVRVD